MPKTKESGRVGFKLEVPHRDGCWYLDPTVDQPAFVLHDGMEWDRARNGRRGGGASFSRFRCNDPDCPAIALVRSDVLAEFVTRGVENRPE